MHFQTIDNYTYKGSVERTIHTPRQKSLAKNLDKSKKQQTLKCNGRYDGSLGYSSATRNLNLDNKNSKDRYVRNQEWNSSRDRRIVSKNSVNTITDVRQLFYKDK